MPITEFNDNSNNYLYLYIHALAEERTSTFIDWYSRTNDDFRYRDR